MSDHYVLNPDNSIRPVDFEEYLQICKTGDKETTHKRVAYTTVYPGCAVSTVFLGLDHQFGDGPPLVFETMIFGGHFDSWQDRYTTWNEAEAGHANAVEMCQPIMTEDPVELKPSKVTRIEVVDERGRVYSRWDCSIELSHQDDGRTLKVFVKPHQGEK